LDALGHGNNPGSIGQATNPRAGTVENAVAQGVADLAIMETGGQLVGFAGRVIRTEVTSARAAMFGERALTSSDLEAALQAGLSRDLPMPTSLAPLDGALARPPIGVIVTRSTNPLSPVLEFDAYGNEITYRTMSPEQARQFERTGKLPPTTETSTAASLEYASGKYTKNGGITFKLTTAPGTSAQLQEIGIAANKPAALEFPEMSTQTGPWMQTNARFKVEGGQMTTQLGQGRALEIFNRNLVDFVRLPKGPH
jgi:hypothetical protein